MFALCCLAIPEQILTSPQPIIACVGDNVSLSSFVTLSALANNVKVTWLRVAPSSLAPTDNGVVTSDYGYKLDSVTALDTGRYYAEVTVPDVTVETPFNGPAVDLIVIEKPSRFSKSCQTVFHVESVHAANAYIICILSGMGTSFTSVCSQSMSGLD